MAETMIGTVEDVRMRTLNDNREIFIVKMNGKELSTFKRELAASAKALLNQQAKLLYDTKQNGQYTNYWLNEVESAAAQTEIRREGITQTQIDIRRSVAVKLAIKQLQYFPPDSQHWRTVMQISPGIYQFMYGSEGNWTTEPEPEPGMADMDSIPF